jgi:hypothetical protein
MMNFSLKNNTSHKKIHVLYNKNNNNNNNNNDNKEALMKEIHLFLLISKQYNFFEFLF